MIDKKFEGKELTPPNYKDFVLDLEKANLTNIDKEDKKVMVAKIVRLYEEARKNDNK